MQIKTQQAKRVINLLSDTVTRPTPAMRQWIAQAQVGDDVSGSDPSVNYLQRFAAELLNKPAALFVPSGTMSNLIAVGSHCNRGDEIILGTKAHIFMYEGGGASAFMGVGFHTIENARDGTLPLEELAHAVREDDSHYPNSKLVAVENTQNTCGGRVLSTEYMSQVAHFCKQHELLLHVDGARLANASVKLNVPLHELVKDADSVSLCLSKGLGAPVGSILAGSEDFIYRAHRLRKSLGGGMRQAGIIAAAGTFALQNNIQRLTQDHENAQKLALGLSKIPGIHVEVEDVDTNIVFFTVDEKETKLSIDDFVKRLANEKGVLLGGGYHFGTRIRAVTHLEVSSEDVDHVLQSVQEVLTPRRN